MDRRLAYPLALLATLGLGYAVNRFEAQMEEARVNIIVRNIRTGLQVAIGERLMRGQDDRLAELAKANPLEFLGHTPEGFIGETAVPDGAGSWRFDPTTRQLEYRPLHPGAFAGRDALRWRLTTTGTVAGRPAGLRLDAG